MCEPVEEGEGTVVLLREPVSECGVGQPCDPAGITHACRIAAYNAESALARLLAPHYARANDEARSLIREALSCAGDLHITDGHIHVTLNPLSAPRRTRALAAICELLNDTQTVYPGTDLVLTYSVKPHPGTT